MTARGKKKNIIGQKERKGQPRHISWKKIKRYAQCYYYKSAQHEWSQLQN